MREVRAASGPALHVRIGFGVIVLAGLAAFLGTYWDDAWHTDYGRDDFFIPPHMVLYAGVAVMGAVAALGGLVEWRRTGNLRAVWSNPALRLALLGVVATLAAAPVDEIWHVAFGRDAVVWSPPHMLGFAALFALATGFMLAAYRTPGPWGVALTLVMGAFLIGAAHVPVMEYESDVPQFAVLWYLPVLAAGTALTFAMVEARRRVEWAVVLAALAYTGIRAGILGFLAALEHSLLFVPPIVVPAIAFEVTRRIGWSPAARATAHAVTLYAVYWPFVNLALGGIRVGVADVALGLPLAAVAAWLVLTAFRKPARLRAPGYAVAVIASLALLPGEALAHDPGQGTVVGTARLSAVHLEDRVRLDVELVVVDPRSCDRFEPVQVVARRAGVTLTGTLERVDPCRFGGAVAVTGRGRWFIYAEMDMTGRPVETWLPVTAGAGVAARETDVYIPPARGVAASRLQVLSGIVLYALCLGFLVIGVWAARREEEGSETGPNGRPEPRRGGRPKAIGAAATASSLVVALAFASPSAAQADPGVGPEGAPPPAVSPVPDTDSAAHPPDARRSRRHVLIPRPLLFHDHETGWSAGIDVFHSHRPDGAERPPTMSHLYLVYASTGMAMGSISSAVHTADDLYRFAGHAMYVHFPHTFYGIGRDLSAAVGEPYISRSASLALSGRRRLGPAVVMGAGWSGERYDMIERVPGGRLADGTITGADGGVISTVSVQGGIDTRLGLPNALRGTHLVTSVRGSHPIVGSDFQYAQLGVDARHFVPLPAGQVLGLHAVASATLGDAPFQVLPRMGGDAMMRGYSPMFHRDRHLVAAQVEHRVPVWWRVGAVGFAGAGAVAPDLAGLDLDAVRVSWGGGLRFAINRAQRLNLRADYAMGREGSRLYVTVGETF